MLLAGWSHENSLAASLHASSNFLYREESDNKVMIACTDRKDGVDYNHLIVILRSEAYDKFLHNVTYK